MLFSIRNFSVTYVQAKFKSSFCGPLEIIKKIDNKDID